MKHVKTFEGYVYESEVNETLYEASHAGRAWSGKIKNIDNLMSWMYDKGILNKGEQDEKDRKFREYYRWYNDGDTPSGVYGKDEEIEAYLEKSIEGFIKKVLAKYTGKYDRRDFRIDTLLSDLKTLENIVAGHTAQDGQRGEPDPHGLLNYWGKKINTNDSEFEKMLGELRPLYDTIDKAANDAIAKEVKDGVYKDRKSYDIPSSSHNISYRRKLMQDENIWTPDLEKKYNTMKDLMMKMHEILTNVIEATEKMKNEIGV